MLHQVLHNISKTSEKIFVFFCYSNPEAANELMGWNLQVSTKNDGTIAGWA